VLRSIETGLEAARRLEARRQAILKALSARSPAVPSRVMEGIRAATDLITLEDLYLPYRPHRYLHEPFDQTTFVEPEDHGVDGRRSSRADQARERGLQALADGLLDPRSPDPQALARRLLSGLGGALGVDEALQGAADIIAELASDWPPARAAGRRAISGQGERGLHPRH
jgi:protein Tex